MIPPSVSCLFPRSVQIRGTAYRLQGAVKVVRDDSAAFGARVRGTRTYQVQIAFDGTSASATCTCPFFASTGPCKHLWATLLEADWRGSLRSVARIHPESEDHDLDDIDLDDDAPDAPGVRPTGHGARPAAASWRQALAVLDHEAARMQAAARVGLHAGFEIVHAIDVPASKERGALILAALVRRRLKNGSLSRPTDLALTRNAIPLLRDDEDRRVLQTLEGALSGRDYSVSHSESSAITPRWRLSDEVHADVVARLAASGRLLVDLGEAELAGAATWAGDPPWHVVLEADAVAGGWSLRAVLCRDAERMDASELVLVGPLFAVLPDLRLAPLRWAREAKWLVRQRLHGPLRVPEAEGAPWPTPCSATARA